MASRATTLKLVFGTDAVAGAHGRNAEALVCRVRRGGQPAMDAIVSATSRAAESLRLDKELGRIAVGYAADIIATDGDPSQQIEAAQRVVFVMRAGTVYRNDGTVSHATDDRNGPKGAKGPKGSKSETATPIAPTTATSTSLTRSLVPHRESSPSGTAPMRHRCGARTASRSPICKAASPRCRRTNSTASR